MAREARAQPAGCGREWVGWMSTKFPLEIPAALGLTVFCPESAAAAASCRGESSALCQAAEEMGYCRDLCSYVRMGMALAAGQTEAGLPRPDFLLCCNNICSGMLQWYRALARTLDIPLFLLDFPYQEDREPSPSLVAYLRAQITEVVRGLEELTGRRWGPLRFQDVCRQANRSAQVWQRVMDAALASPSPLGNMELFDYMPLMVTGRCSKETEQRLEALAGKLQSRTVRPGGVPKRRIFWEGTPCWPVLDRMVDLLDRKNVQIVADTLTPSLGFRYEDLDGLIRAYCGTINGVSLERGLEMRTELCRRYRVEGVLVHYNRSCRPWCGALQETERRLGRELEVPVVSFHGDQGDPEVFSAAQFELRLDTLCELMEQKS